MPPWCESILGLKAEAVQGKEVSLEWTETSGGLWECGTTLEFLSPFDTDLRDPLWWPQESPVPMRVVQGPLGIPLPYMLGTKTLCGDGAGT